MMLHENAAATKKKLVLAINNKLSFDERCNNSCKTANKKSNAGSRKNDYLKQNQKELVLSSLVISHFSYCLLI